MENILMVNIEKMIENARTYNDLNSMSFLENIKTTSIENSVSINDIVEYLLTTNLSIQQKNILNCLLRFYPPIKKSNHHIYKINIKNNSEILGTSEEKIINNNNKPRIKQRPEKLEKKAGR
jgi:hypothetical protein